MIRGPLAAGDSWLMVRVEAPQPVLSSQCRDVERGSGAPGLSFPGRQGVTDPVAMGGLCGGGLGMSAPPRSQEDQPALWKLHLPPTLWPDIVATLSTDAGVRYMCDWGGGACCGWNWAMMMAGPRACVMLSRSMVETITKKGMVCWSEPLRSCAPGAMYSRFRQARRLV